MRRVRATGRSAAALAITAIGALGLIGCTGDVDPESDAVSQESDGASVPPEGVGTPTGVVAPVTELVIGHGGDGFSPEGRGEFAPEDTIALVITTEPEYRGPLTVTWRFEDGQVVKQDEVRPENGEAGSDVGGSALLPEGVYTVTVEADGEPAGEVAFTVQH